MFAYIGELFAYRLDLNAHENFITQAQRKESILRLAKLISYTPTRNLPARGLVKYTSITTTEQIFDSNGRLRMIFDKSFNFKEWEAVDKEYFGQDMSKMHEVVRQNIEENVYLPLEVTNKINNLQSENQDLKQMLIQTTTNLNKVLVISPPTSSIARITTAPNKH